MIDEEEPLDPSWLRDHDWVEVNKLRCALKVGGVEALTKAWGELWHKDFDQFTRVACALIPDFPQDVKDALERAGYTFRELIELAKKKQH